MAEIRDFDEVFIPLCVLAFPISTPREFMRYCYACEGEHIFVADRECASGSVGRCLNCGDERIVPFTRTTMEEE